MNKLLMSIKREYWEYRSVVVGLPLILALLAFVGAVGVEVVQNRVSEVGVTALIENLADRELTPDERRELRDELAEAKVLDTNYGSRFEPMAWFVGAAWFAGFYYLLGAFYNDRKDKSILFFKSLPVAEHYNVMIKLLFGTLGVVAISVAIGWGLSVLLTLFGLGNHEGDGLSLANSAAYFVAPLQAGIIGLFWGAPVFAYLALASAAAKRSPFLLAIIPIIVLSFLEGVIFENVEIISFFFSHMPFAVTAHMTDGAGTGAFNTFFVEQSASMTVGLIIAGLFVAAAIWHRNNKFEI